MEMEENADMIPMRTKMVFFPHNEIPWTKVYDDEHREVPLEMRIIDDEGFYYSPNDDCFVIKSSQHFQITTSLHPDHPHPASLLLDNGQWKPISTMKLGFAGWNGGQEREIMQLKDGQGPWVSRPVELEQLPPGIVTKVTVPLLRFDVPTNSEEREHDFHLEVRLLAITDDGTTFLIQSYQSERIQVRAPPAFIFKPYRENSWPIMMDTQYRRMSKFDMRASIEEGFEFSEEDYCYVNKRMNSFEVATSITNNNTHDTAWICTAMHIFENCYARANYSRKHPILISIPVRG